MIAFIWSLRIYLFVTFKKTFSQFQAKIEKIFFFLICLFNQWRKIYVSNGIQNIHPDIAKWNVVLNNAAVVKQFEGRGYVLENICYTYMWEIAGEGVKTLYHTIHYIPDIRVSI